MAEIYISVAAKVSEYLFDPIRRQLGYLFNYHGNITDLTKQIEKLDRASVWLQQSVDEARRQGDEVIPAVHEWLKGAERIIQQSKDFFEDEKKASKSSFNLKSRCHLSEKAKKQAEDIVLKIQQAHNFGGRVSYCLPSPFTSSASFKDDEAFQSRESAFNRIMEALRNEDMSMIGVWGMGGVGKTTLVKQVAKQAEEDKLFDKVVMVLNVSQTPSYAEIQGKIAKMLALKFEEEEEERAILLSQSLKKQEKILVILDDIWEKLELGEIGIPYGDDHKGCKVLLTSREHLVLSKDMRTQKEFHLQHLSEEEAWNLFKKTAGDSVEKPELQPIATEVVKECEGLPVAIVTVAKALKGESVAVWSNALEDLRRSAPTNIIGVSKNVYSCLELSVNHLESHGVKSLFLLCGLLGDGNISLDDLLKYGTGLDLFGDIYSMEQARNKLLTLVEILKASSLLLEVEDGQSDELSSLFFQYDENKFVRMHDVVRDVARAIAFKDPHQFVVKEALQSEEWSDTEEFSKYTGIFLKCRDIRVLSKGLVCPKLELLISRSNDSSLRIRNTVFQEMKKLKVLGLSKMCLIPVPLSLYFLPNLRTLCLDHCLLGNIAIIGKLKKLRILSLVSSKIEQLPKEMMQLSSLRWLDLRNCSYLREIPQNVISSLSQLEYLCMENSGESNVCLSELKHLLFLRVLDVKIPDLNMTPPDIPFDKLTRYRILVGDHWKWHHTYKASRVLKLSQLKSSNLMNYFSKQLERIEDLELKGLDDTVHFANELHMGAFLELKHLYIHESPGFRYIINSMGRVSPRNAFPPTLEELRLWDLINLDAVCRGPIPVGCFGNLRILQVGSCKNLEHLLVRPTGQRIVFPQLRSLSLEDLPKLRNFYSTRIYSEGILDAHTPLFNRQVAFPSLEDLDISNLDNVEKIWHNHDFIADSFGKLKRLSIRSCQKMQNVIPSNMLKRLSSLQILKIVDCNLVEEVFDLEAIDSEETHDIHALQLRELRLDNLKNLKYIWNKAPQGLLTYQNLKPVRVSNCPSFEIPFPGYVVRSLLQRKEGDMNSRGVGKMVAHENLAKPVTMFLFPEVTSLTNSCLKELECFDLVLHTLEWRLFKTLEVESCESLEMLASKLDKPVANPIFLCDKAAFSNLGFLNLSLKLEEIQHLQLLCEIFSNLRILIIENYPFLSKVLSSNFLQSLRNLEKLTVKKCDQLKEAFDLNGLDHVEMLSKLEELYLIDLLELKSICNNSPPQVSCFHNLKLIHVKQCGRLMYLFSTPMALGLVQLQDICIEDCCEMKEIVMAEEGVTDKIIFPEITHVSLLKLPKLTSFYLRTQTLENIHMGDSNTASGVLFNEEVAFPSLEELNISNLDNVEKIWHNHDLIADSFGKLKRLSVLSCQKMRDVIPSNMLKRLSSLQILKIVDCNLVEKVFDLEAIDSEETHDIPALQLRELCLDNLKNLKYIWNKAPQGLLAYQNLRPVQVSNCPSLEIPFPGYVVRSILQVKEVDMNSCGLGKIVAHEDVAKAVTMFLCPEVTSLTNSYLNQLECFYLGLHTLEWPMLKTLEVESHENPEILASKLDNPVEQPIFLCDKVAFPSFEDLDIFNLDSMEKIWYNEYIADSFGKLKRLSVRSCQKMRNIIPSNMLKRLSSLQILKIVDCNSVEEVFDLQAIDRKESHDILALQLRELCLDNLKNLKYIWNKAPQGLLTYQNLKPVRVSYCPSLEIPFPGYVVRSLLQVKDVDMNSRGVGKIVAHEDVAQAVTMVLFPEVTSLTSSCLKELTCFYLGPHTLEWPMLKTLEVECCESLEILASKLDKTVEQPIFLCDKAAFPNLEFLNLSLKVEAIQHLHLLLGALFNLKILIVENCPFLLNLFSSDFIKSLKNLKNLTVKKCDRLRGVFDLTELDHAEDEQAEMLSKLEELNLIDLPELKSICNNSPPQVLCFPNLKLIQVKQCHDLTYLFSASMALGLVQLQEFCIEDCSEMKEIVIAEEGVTDKIIFHEITRVSLLKLPKLTSFYLRTQTLENIHMGVAPGVLFNEKVAFPSLEDLDISNLDNVEKIWHNEFIADSYGKLKRLSVGSSQKLQNVIPYNMLKRLPSLQILKIVDCNSVEEVFDLEAIDSQENHDIPALQLRELCLDNLKNLKCVWNRAPQGLLTYQNLERVQVSHCPSLEIPFPGYVVRSLLQVKEVDMNSRGVHEDIAKAVTMFLFPEVTSLTKSCPKELACFYLGLDTLEWSMLKTLEVESCESLEKLASKLDKPVENSIFLCDKVALPNLEFLNLSLKVEEIQHLHLLFGALFNLKILIVENCPFLLNLFSSDFIKSLKNLKELTVKKCDRLQGVFDLTGLDHAEDEHVEMLSKLEKMNLIDLPGLKSICNNSPPQVLRFPNLKLLQVKQCHGLTHLFSPSMVLGLVQLHEFCIEDCSDMKAIVIAEERLTDKITFHEITRVSLLKLPKLTSFYLRNQTLEKIHMGDSNIAPGVLFNEKVAFPKLEILYVSGLDNVKKIWHHQLLADSFGKLKEMKVENCKELQNISKSNVLNWLPSLEFLRIASCHKLTEVFDLEETNVQKDETNNWLSRLVLDDLQNLEHICNKVLGKQLCLQNLKFLEVHNCGSLKRLFSPYTKLEGAEKVIDKIDFPELASLSLKSLPSLASFYPGSQTLRRVGPGDHGILITVLFDEKVAFPRLESLNISGLASMKKIWHNKLIENSFSKLAEVEVECCNEVQNGLPLFVLRSSNLQILRIANCGKLKEVFDLEGADIRDDETETQLNELVLHDLPQLQYIWNKDPYGILTYENLDLVEVLRCEVLKGQFPSCLTRDLSQLEKQLIRSRWKKDLEGKDEGKDFAFPEVTYDELELVHLQKIKGKEVVVASESDYVGEISEDMPGSSG